MPENDRSTVYHEMDAGCTAAFQQFLQKVNAMRNVNIYMTGTFRRNYNDVLQDGKAGPRLVLSFGGRNRTNYTFQMPELHGKNSAAKSLHLVGDRSRPAVEVYSGLSGKEFINRAADVGADGLGADINYRMARMFNSMDFSGLFRDAGALESVSSDMAPGYRAKAGIISGAKQIGDGSVWRGLHNAELMLADGKDLPWMPGSASDPKALSGAMGWGHIMEQQEIAGGKLSDEDAIAAERKKAGTMSKLLGLDALYDALYTIDRNMGNNGAPAPALTEVFDGPDGENVMRGLANLCYFKHVVDDGDYRRTNSRGAVITYGVREEPDDPRLDKSGIYYRGCEASDEAAMDLAAVAAADAERGKDVALFAYQKMRHNSVGDKRFDPRQVERMRDYNEYRLLRCASLGEDFGKPSSMPKVTVRYTGDISGRLSTDNLAAVMEDGREMPLVAFFQDKADGIHPDGQHKDWFPLVSLSMRDRSGLAETMGAALSQLDPKKKPDGMDLAELEMALFTDKKKGRDRANQLMKASHAGQTFDQVVGKYYRDRVNYLNGGTDGRGYRTLNYALETATGFPDLETGCVRFGRCQQHDAGLASVEGFGRRSTVPGNSAMSFRRDDALRAEYAAQFGDGKCPSAVMYDQTVSGLTGQVFAAKSSGDESGAVRASSELNDFIVLCECYGGDSLGRIREIRDDVESAYALKPGSEIPYGLLYRPADRASLDAVTAVYGDGSIPMDGARVSGRIQRTHYGLFDAVSGGLSDLEGQARDDAKRNVLDVLGKAAMSYDTLLDGKYGTLAWQVATDTPGVAQTEFTQGLAHAAGPQTPASVSRINAMAQEMDAQEADVADRSVID